MDNMGMDVQNLFWVSSERDSSPGGQANKLPEFFSSFLEGLDDKTREISFLGPKGGEIRSLSDKKGIDGCEVLGDDSLFLVFPKDRSFMDTEILGAEPASEEIPFLFPGKKDLPLDLPLPGEKKNDPSRDKVIPGIMESFLGPGKTPVEVPPSKEALPTNRDSSVCEFENLKASCLGEANSQLNSTTSPVEAYGLGPGVLERNCLVSQEAISSSASHVAKSGGECHSVLGLPIGIFEEKHPCDSPERSLGPWDQINEKGEVAQWRTDSKPSPGDPHALGRRVGLQVQGPKGPFSEVRGSFLFDAQYGEGARGQEVILAIEVKEAKKLDESLVVCEARKFSQPGLENPEFSGQGKGLWGFPIEFPEKETSQSHVAFGVRDSRTEASQEGSLWDNDFSVSIQGFKTPSAVEISRRELLRFPGITEERRSQGELPTFNGPKGEGPSLRGEKLEQTPEIWPADQGSLLSKKGPLLTPSKDETAEANGSQRPFQSNGGELREGRFQTVQIVFKEAEDLTRIRLRLHQNNLDALFVVPSAEKKSELEANLGQLQRELFQSGFFPQLAVEVGGRYGSSGFYKGPGLDFLKNTETECRDIQEEISHPRWNPWDGSIHLRV